MTFDLARSRVDFGRLREWVTTDGAAAYRALPGLRCKTWFSDETRRVWGAVYLVEERSDLRLDRLPRLPDGHTGPVGAPPTSVQWFDMEAFVAGPGGTDGLEWEGVCPVPAPGGPASGD
ncbi:hypothetical protein [Pseudonocardia sp.]|uniref:hypothetical protein n=1 Tax=Pseudonocardia sp. TaxID=60912 RepID=UPI00261E1170|nr:hypothetical protein [Pseudonocardia sp.]